jgi:hypothetical protein
MLPLDSVSLGKVCSGAAADRFEDRLDLSDPSCDDEVTFRYPPYTTASKLRDSPECRPQILRNA